ncbi:hypothetical protein D3Z55_07165 [Clostridiaceae bacterium]|nr:hypothetical protein [Clostridiaceae bacterium]
MPLWVFNLLYEREVFQVHKKVNFFVESIRKNWLNKNLQSAILEKIWKVIRKVKGPGADTKV